MSDNRHPASSEGARPLGLATAAFLVSFFAWSMLGPLGPDLQDEIGLSELELAVVIAVPCSWGR